MSNIETLLEGNLDDLADLPEFKAFPAGVHKVTLELVPSENDDKELIINANFTYVAPVELGDVTVTPPKAGDKSGLYLNMANEFGQGGFKEIGKAYAAHMEVELNTLSKRAVIDGVKGLEFVIVTTIRFGKKGSAQEGKEFMQLQKIQVG